MDHSPGFLRVAEAARAKIREISISEVQARLPQAGSAFELVDVREDGEFAAGYLPGARHLGRGVLERDVEKAIPDTARAIVVYCGGGYRSALAAESLAAMGYTNVLSMAGGYRGWTKRACHEYRCGLTSGFGYLTVLCSRSRSVLKKSLAKGECAYASRTSTTYTSSSPA